MISVMSIATRTGDAGTTGLMYNVRVSKTHPRVHTYGAVDELNSTIGLARSFIQNRWIEESLLKIQKDLVTLMGELATPASHLERYVKDGYVHVTPEMIAPLDELIKKIESENTTFDGWATPGATSGSAALDIARTVCRRAERHACQLSEAGDLDNESIIIFLNRLSDTLWLMARWIEHNINPGASK